MEITVKRNAQVLCVSSVPYSPDIIRSMQGAGLQIYLDGKPLKRRGKATGEADET